MIREYLSELLRIAPFSVDTLSGGRPKLFHPAMVASSVSTTNGFGVGLIGIPFFPKKLTKSLMILSLKLFERTNIRDEGGCKKDVTNNHLEVFCQINNGLRPSVELTSKGTDESSSEIHLVLTFLCGSHSIVLFLHDLIIGIKEDLKLTIKFSDQDVNFFFLFISSFKSCLCFSDSKFLWLDGDNDIVISGDVDNPIAKTSSGC